MRRHEREGRNSIGTAARRDCSKRKRHSHIARFLARCCDDDQSSRDRRLKTKLRGWACSF